MVGRKPHVKKTHALYCPVNLREVVSASRQMATCHVSNPIVRRDLKTVPKRPIFCPRYPSAVGALCPLKFQKNPTFGIFFSGIEAIKRERIIMPCRCAGLPYKCKLIIMHGNRAGYNAGYTLVSLSKTLSMLMTCAVNMCDVCVPPGTT